MTPDPTPAPGIGFYAKVIVGLAFILVLLGGLVTSWQAGMAVPDWPLSFGSVNPAGWWGNFPVRLEHGHRLFAAFVGLNVIALCVCVFRDSAARPVRTLSVIAVFGVVLQGIFGGLRVQLETAGHPQAAFALRIIHGCVAAAEVSLLVALATVLSSRWSSWPALAPLPRRLAWATTAAIYLQLCFGAAMRHLGAGLAIPTWPAATPSGSLLPVMQHAATPELRHAMMLVHLNFTHTRFGALAVTGLILLLGHRAFRAGTGCRRLQQPALWLLALVLVQFTLGVFVIWHFKPIGLTTAHVVTGHLLLAVSLLLSLRLSRASSASVLNATHP